MAIQVYEAAKELGLKSKELIEKLDDERVTSHLSTIPDDILESLGISRQECVIETESKEDTEADDSVDAVVIETKSKKLKLPEGVTPEQVWNACTGIGNKHPLWKYKDLGRKPRK